MRSIGKIRALIVVAVAAVLTVSLTQSAQASFSKVSKSSSSFPEKVSWVTVCSVSGTADVDPIVAPGKPGASHNHTFSGPVVDAFTTPELLSRTKTNCTNSGDHAAYWMPTLYSAGKAVMPYTTRMYYRAGTFDTSKVQPMPFGLKMIAGSAMAMKPQDAGIAGYHCREEGVGPTVSKQALPPVCPQGSLFEASVEFPNCWDGVNLDSPDHKSHMSYAVNYKCDAAHPVMVPQLTIAERFTPGLVDGSKVTLAAMKGMTPSNLTLHADFMNAWDPALMQTLLRDCIRAGVACEGVSDKRMPPVTNN